MERLCRLPLILMSHDQHKVGEASWASCWCSTRDWWSAALVWEPALRGPGGSRHAGGIENRWERGAQLYLLHKFIALLVNFKWHLVHFKALYMQGDR